MSSKRDESNGNSHSLPRITNQHAYNMVENSIDLVKHEDINNSSALGPGSLNSFSPFAAKILEREKQEASVTPYKI